MSQAEQGGSRPRSEPDLPETLCPPGTGRFSASLDSLSWDCAQVVSTVIRAVVLKVGPRTATSHSVQKR